MILNTGTPFAGPGSLHPATSQPTAAALRCEKASSGRGTVGGGRHGGQWRDGGRRGRRTDGTDLVRLGAGPGSAQVDPLSRGAAARFGAPAAARAAAARRPVEPHIRTL